MTAELIHCPYCNAALPLVEMDLTQARLRCPRCGDSFPNRQRLSAAEVNGPPAATAAQTATTTPRLSNAAVARIILGLMLGAAVVALSFALVTVSFRRANDNRARGPRAPINAPLQTLTPATPAELTALGYLPTECNLVAGLNVLGLLDQSEGQELLRETTGGVWDLGLRQFSAWSGLKPDEFEHVVAGARVADQLPRLFVIARTRQPYDPKVVAKKLAPTVADTHHGKPVYRLKLGGPFSGLLWLHSERTLILTINFLGSELKDLDAIPGTPRRGVEGFSLPVAIAIEKRLPREAFLWLVGDLLPAVALRDGLEMVAKLPSATKDALGRVSNFTLGLRVQKGLTLAGSIETRKAEDVPSVLGFLRKFPVDGAESYEVVGPPPQMEAADVGSERRIMLQARFTPAGLREVLKQGS